MSGPKRNHDEFHPRTGEPSATKVLWGDDGGKRCEGALGPLLTVGQLASELGLNKRLVYRLVEQGHLPHIRMGRRIRFVPDVVAAFLKERAEAGVYSEKRTQNHPPNRFRTGGTPNLATASSADIPPAQWKTPAKRHSASMQVPSRSTRAKALSTAVDSRQRGSVAARDARHAAAQEKE